MTELKVLAGDKDQAEMHIVFVHGLGGGPETTWRSSTKSGDEIWPKWLEDDLPNVAVWTIGYDVAPSSWIGHSLPLEDRAQNIWSRLRAEPALIRGDIAFIGHSMGGLVIAQLLRCVDRDSSERDAESFGARVRRIVFLGTPHKGSRLATIASWVPWARPTVAISDLEPATPQLRDLSAWLRKHVQTNAIDTFQLAEGKGLPLWKSYSIPLIVAPESADAGLIDTPTVVDEDHLSICKPRDRQSYVYVTVLEFLARKLEHRSTKTRMVESVDAIGAALKEGITTGREHHREVRAMLSDIAADVRPHAMKNSIILDRELTQQLDGLRQRRFFGEADVVAEAKSLANEVENGDFAAAGLDLRKEAIAWCARFLAMTEPEEAEALLARNYVKDGEFAAAARFL